MSKQTEKYEKKLNGKRHRRGKDSFERVVLSAAAVLVVLGTVLWYTSRPTADDVYRRKYCVFQNEANYNSGKEHSKVWLCPAPLK